MIIIMSSIIIFQIFRQRVFQAIFRIKYVKNCLISDIWILKIILKCKQVLVLNDNEKIV